MHFDSLTPKLFHEATHVLTLREAVKGEKKCKKYYSKSRKKSAKIISLFFLLWRPPLLNYYVTSFLFIGNQTVFKPTHFWIWQPWQHRELKYILWIPDNVKGDPSLWIQSMVENDLIFVISLVLIDPWHNRPILFLICMKNTNDSCTVWNDKPDLRLQEIIKQFVAD